MEVEIISKESIKPSSPTPLHLKNHKLSYLDIKFGRLYVPVVLYYPMNQDTNLSPSDIVSERLHVLKQSLSETLSIFYPFAGKIKDSYSIDCNDEGVYFVEAKVKSPLNKFLSNPSISLINKFLPDEAKWRLAPGEYITGVQVTTFACGGIAVGVYVSHTIADGTAFSSFLKSWAAIACKSTKEALICPKFDASSLFPYNNDAHPVVANPNLQEFFQPKLGRYITRRYVFDASAIAKLKAEATRSCEQNPSRVELVTALFAKFFKARSGSDKPLLVVHTVNLRRRAMPQFSECYMGNFIWQVSVLCKDKEVELGDFVCQMKEAMTKVNGDFVNSLQGDGGWLEAVKSEREIFTDSGNMLAFGSWCNFGLYDLDFGWGKPVWASVIDITEFGDSGSWMFLMDTRHRDGVEAWAHFSEEKVAMLESDKEFLAFATVNPSPINVS